MLRWLWLSLVIIGLDQISKQLVESSLMVYETIPVMPFFNLTLAYNEGAAFSFLSDQGGWQRWFFSGLALLVSIVMVIWMGRLQQRERLIAISLSLIIGGALGNFIDRVLFGHVIDFIDVYYEQWHWPAFNVADSAIFMGVVFMLFDAFRGESTESQLNK
ncbi:signal peptidase II [Solemya velesiana gill symbiont]|uniref:Lipoprotein signal peptidase n=1 Tax=Solemya velesiana gill symbiont TaxID=1918948 RepID=A0A1T2KV80_9GAMM|nr:signal peptidase II [Solemya velesiana gill symbiont]OOZ36759.1 signal peptidase II [Solemya velesiana gill symbiont]